MTGYDLLLIVACIALLVWSLAHLAGVVER